MLAIQKRSAQGKSSRGGSEARCWQAGNSYLRSGGSRESKALQGARSYSKQERKESRRVPAGGGESKVTRNGSKDRKFPISLITESLLWGFGNISKRERSGSRVHKPRTLPGCQSMPFRKKLMVITRQNQGSTVWKEAVLG